MRKEGEGPGKGRFVSKQLSDKKRKPPARSILAFHCCLHTLRRQVRVEIKYKGVWFKRNWSCHHGPDRYRILRSMCFIVLRRCVLTERHAAVMMMSESRQKDGIPWVERDVSAVAEMEAAEDGTLI